MNFINRYNIVNLDKLTDNKIVCLTLDLEQDYGDLLDESRYNALSSLDELIIFLKKKNIPLTCFVQGSLLESQPYAIDKLSKLNVEFELHTYSHPKSKEIDNEFEIKKGRKAFIKFFDHPPLGYRSPAGFVSTDMFNLLPIYGFKFDSSVVPSFRPDVYNSLTKPITPYQLKNSNVIEFPVTVFSKFLRIPISLSYLKLIGKNYINLLKVFQLPKLIIFNFHLHDLEVFDTSDDIPIENFSPIYRYIFKRIYKADGGMKLLRDFIEFIIQKNYNFLKMEQLYEMFI